MTTIPQPTDVHAAQFRALQALGSTANPERQGPTEARRAGYGLICGRTLIHSRALAALSQALRQPPERAQRPAQGSPGRVDMAVRPLTAARPFVPLSNVASPLDAIPAVTERALKHLPERAQRPAQGSPGKVGMAVHPPPAARLCALPPNVTIVLHLDAIPAVRQHGRAKKGPSPAPTPADARRVRAPKRAQRPTRPSPPSSPRSRGSP